METHHHLLGILSGHPHLTVFHAKTTHAAHDGRRTGKQPPNPRQRLAQCQFTLGFVFHTDGRGQYLFRLYLQR